MQEPSFDIPESTNTKIHLTWVPLVDGPQTGGIPVDEYRVLYKDDVASSWTSVVSSTIAYTEITPLIPGTFYTFKIIAANKYGSSIESPSVRIIAG